MINGIKTSRKNEITWEVSGRILGAGVILLQNLQQQRRESTLLCCCRIGCVFPEHSVSKPLRRRELDCVIGGKGECLTCLWVASSSGGPCHNTNVRKPGRKPRSPSASASANVSILALMSFSTSASVRPQFFLSRFTRSYLFMWLPFHFYTADAVSQFRAFGVIPPARGADEFCALVIRRIYVSIT